jgi:hypothetical protein
MSIFDDEPTGADIEDDYIERVVPYEGAVLWLASVEESPVWESMSPEQHMEAADMFAQAAYSGSLSVAEDFLEFLEIDWDDDDIGEFWDLYDQVSG